MKNCFEALAEAIEKLEPEYWDIPCEACETIAQQVRHTLGYVRVLYEAVINNQTLISYPDRPKTAFNQSEAAKEARAVSTLVKALCEMETNPALQIKETQKDEPAPSSLSRELMHVQQHSAHHADTIFRIIMQERTIQQYVPVQKQAQARKELKEWASQRIPWSLRAAQATQDC